MKLNDLLNLYGINPAEVLVFRHRPTEPALNKAFPLIAADEPDVLNAYQQTQGERVENAMKGAAYVASFIGHEPGHAVFVGHYKIGSSTRLSHSQYWEVPAYKRMKEL